MATWEEVKDNPIKQDLITKRAQIIRLIREFFWSENFMEEDTLSTWSTAGQEPYLNPISLNITNEKDQAQRFYLQTSPEYAMKKLLSVGEENIFQICHCWRDRESFGGLHYPEFLMLEWYRKNKDYFQIMTDTENLFKYISKNFGQEFLIYKDQKIKISEAWDRLTMREVWQKYLHLDLNDYLTIESLKKLVAEKGYQVNMNDTYENLFYQIFLNEIEQKLGREKPVIIYEYPATMASLSRLCPHDSRYTERFEVYISGVELANAFGELIDGTEQEKRFLAEQELRKQLNQESLAIDKTLLKALNYMQDNQETASGIALGVDRLVMLFTGADRIDDLFLTTLSS